MEAMRFRFVTAHSLLVSLVFVALLVSGCAGGPQPDPGVPEAARESAPVTPAVVRPERVLLITIDTLRADYVGCYGSKLAKTPTLDRIAAEGVRFEVAIAPTPLTLPSHASIMTGLEPPRHGAHTNVKFRLEGGIPTLSERFGAARFATAAFVGAMVLDRRYGLARGFDVYDDQMGVRRSVGAASERTADRVVDAALEWLNEAPERFFVWVHLYDPHGTYDPPRGFRPKLKEPIPNPEEIGVLAAAARFVPPMYAGEIYFADTEIGRLLRVVQRRFGDDGTLVVVTSDHGESLGEHGELSHALTLYDATQRVPLLMAGPGVPAGRVVGAPVRLVDVAPTILALAGLPALEGSSGVDLGPWMRGERDDALTAYVETLATQLDWGWSPVMGVRTQRYKYLRTTRPELYDLTEDPGETRNIAAERAPVVEKLDGALETRLEGARPVRPNVAPPPEEIELLESLGYVVRGPETEDHALGWVGGPDPKDRIDGVAKLTEARMHIAAGRPERALTLLEAQPDEGGWISLVRSESALALGNAGEAEVQARKMVAAQPGLAEGYLALGRALEAQGRNDEARSAYQEGLRVDPTEPDSIEGLGRLAESEGDIETAEAYYRQAMESRAPSIEAALRLAALRFEQERSDEAREILERFGDGIDARPEALIRLARAEAKAGYPEEALARLERSLARRRADPALAAAREEIAGEAPGSSRGAD
jgi:arylsulfatase A-like enzyme/Tfp pilus assembly protein PilF